jgi:lipopolysaccharide transport system permease protein
LIMEMAKREITDRYLGQVFGALWAIAHPLMLIVVYVVVFAFVFKIRIGGTASMPLDYTTYLLAGLIPWLGFVEAMSKGVVAISSNATVVKQMIFPIEVLPAKSVVASLITEVIFVALLLVYVIATQHTLSWLVVLFPLLLLFQFMAMMGTVFALAAVGVYFRDLKDFVQVFTVVGMYLMPVFYLPEFVPVPIRPLLYLDPFSYMVWAFQDVLYFGRFEHWWAWPIFAILSVATLALGYRLFDRLKLMFGNVL